LLIAGTTGSGKSVGINAMILSLMFKLPPEKCRFIMIDPKMLELSIYEGVPHLLSPVVTDPQKAVLALKWVVREMESRYELMSKMGVRNIAGFNQKAEDAASKGEHLTRQVQTGWNKETGEAIWETEAVKPEPMPHIVVVIDEMADLMLVAGKDIESAVQRIAQMARAAGIHLITATQRPSVDVITGTIKANFPTRISYMVTTKIDSRTILGEQGAEQLLGMGDLLWMQSGGKIIRVHGPFVKDEEVEAVVNWLKDQGTPQYVEGITDPVEEEASVADAAFGTSSGDPEEDMYREAVAAVVRDKRPTTSYVQRVLRIGYNRAASMIERMEREGVISAADHAGKRQILSRDVGRGGDRDEDAA
jgi:S-DNA-T family DNA segregation ATPase FtsK/SpoIIIE